MTSLGRMRANPGPTKTGIEIKYTANNWKCASFEKVTFLDPLRDGHGYRVHKDLVFSLIHEGFNKS